jgi:hypothetical protein
LKSDSVPVHGNGYELSLWSLDLELTQRRHTAYRQDLIVVVDIKGGSEFFLDSEILKSTTVGPLQYNDYYSSFI